VPAPALGFCVGLEALAAAASASDSEAARPLRIAVGKGRLLGKTLAALRAGGASFGEPDGRRLLVPSADGAFELLLLKDDDVPTYVAHGGADLGVVGSDRVAESGEDVFSPVELPFGECRLSLIGRAGEEFRPNGQPVRVGTKYRRLAERYFDSRKIAHEIVPLAGSVELAAALRLTDVVVDLIETGSTIAANGLAEIETIETSRATVILGRAALVSRRSEIAAFLGRLREKAGAPC
jgi:ATP phosphoribosyltransferase